MKNNLPSSVFMAATEKSLPGEGSKTSHEPVTVVPQGEGTGVGLQGIIILTPFGACFRENTLVR